MPKLGEMVTACQAAAKRRWERAAEEKRNAEVRHQQAHPEDFVSWKELMEDMQMMRDACEVAFGPKWRDRPEYTPVYDAKGRCVRGGLTEVYESAMGAA